MAGGRHRPSEPVADPFDVRARATPTEWMDGDPGYVPDTDPADTFFHVIAQADPRDDKLALMLHLTYAQGKDPVNLPGRRYLVNAHSEKDARAQVTQIEQQIADNDPEHIARCGENSPYKVALVVAADSLLDARRDPDPAEFKESFLQHHDQARTDARRMRSIQAGLA